MADRELNEAKVELSQSRMELEKQDLELAQLRAQVSHLVQDNKHLTNNLTSKANDMSELEALVDKLQEDKLKLSARVNRLISTGTFVFFCRRSFCVKSCLLLHMNCASYNFFVVPSLKNMI